MEVGQFNEYIDMEDFAKRSFWSHQIIKFPVMVGIALCILLPICLLKDISKMRFTSLFGIGSLILLIIIVVVQFPWYLNDYIHNIYRKDDPSTHWNLVNVASGFGPDLYFFTATATVFYGYNCHIGCFPIYRSLKNNNQRRIQKVFFRSIMMDLLIYALVGVAGFLSVPLNTPDLIIERKDLFDPDYFMLIGRILLVLTLLVKIPAKYNSFRLSFLQLIFKDSQVSTKK